MVRETSFGAVVGVWTKSEFGNGCYTFGLGFAKDLLGPIWSLQTLAYMVIEKEEGRSRPRGRTRKGKLPPESKREIKGLKYCFPFHFEFRLIFSLI